MSISIIIPVRNEEDVIGPCLDNLYGYDDIEILVVDGGSTDQTLREITQRGHNPVVSAPGRGTQQDKGARKASGDILLFLHCDTRLPPDFRAHVRDTLQQDEVAAGAFKLGIDANGWGYRIIECGVNLRSRFLGLPYGDQALFMKRDMYVAVEGFPDQPIMEEIALLSRLKKRGRIITAAASATTSARRWQKKGLVKTTVLNQIMLAGWAMGISPERLANWYYRPRKF